MLNRRTGIMTKKILLKSSSFYPIVCLLFCIFISSPQPAWAYQSQQYVQHMGFTLDFETGDLRGWTKTGTAFDYQPTLDDNPTARRRGQPSRHQGRYWIGGYEKYQGKPGQRPGNVQGDRPQGTLTSPSFTIPSGSLSFLVGGGSSVKTRIELLVWGKSVLQASGRNTETMHRVTWNLSSYAGKTGRIRIVDDTSGGWGHINVDDFRFVGAKPRPVSSPVHLTGKWFCNDGGSYFIRQIGNEIWWHGLSRDGGATWSNVFHGRLNGNQVSGRWADVPQGRIQNAGEMTLQILGNRKFKAIRKTGGFGGSEWTR
jgi:hypothetical protein